jgi:hypothetical protein
LGLVPRLPQPPATPTAPFPRPLPPFTAQAYRQVMLYKAIKAGAAGKLIAALMPVLKPKLFDPGFRAYEACSCL